TLRQPLRAQPVADHALVAPQPCQPNLEAVARVQPEELEVLEDAAVHGEARDVDVERRLGWGRRPDHGLALRAEQPHRLPLDLLPLHRRRGGGVAAGPRAAGAWPGAVQAAEPLPAAGRSLAPPAGG